MWAKSLLLACALICAASPAAAGPVLTPTQWIMPVQDRGEDRPRQRELRSLPEIVDMLRSRHGGELINARLEGGDRPVYLIRWRMPDGQVRDFTVDASR
ncbi:MAG: hypothetical protein K2P58_01795 [Hyphomonadaceae bacterium]|nr:hypothetical protein [Hyphomonadaceae bacterium]